MKSQRGWESIPSSWAHERGQRGHAAAVRTGQSANRLRLGTGGDAGPPSLLDSHRSRETGARGSSGVLDERHRRGGMYPPREPRWKYDPQRRLGRHWRLQGSGRHARRGSPRRSRREHQPPGRGHLTRSASRGPRRAAARPSRRAGRLRGGPRRKRQMIERAARIWEVDPDTLDLERGASYRKPTLSCA